MTAEVDLVVVGGGPAGLAVALAARRRGLSATVLERRQPPIDAACGEGLLPDGVARLAELGVEPPRAASAPFAGLRFVDGELAAEGLFPGAPGVGIRRTALHAAMVGRAEAVGVDLRWGVKVIGLTADGVETADGVVRARIQVGADGRHSAVRSWADLERTRPPRHRFGIRRHFRLEPWSDRVEVHWTDGAEAYVTPVGAEEVGVALLWDGAPSSFDALLGRFPELAERLAGSPASSRDRGAGPFGVRASAVIAPGLALVGDATGSLDPISGEGLSLAFSDALALADAVAAGDLGRYAASWRLSRRWPRRMTGLLLLLARSPRLRRRVLASMAGQPGLLSRFLALRLAEPGPRVLGHEGLARLAWAAVAGGGP